MCSLQTDKSVFLVRTLRLRNAPYKKIGLSIRGIPNPGRFLGLDSTLEKVDFFFLGGFLEGRWTKVENWKKSILYPLH